MAKTADKVIFGILAILLIGMGGVFITALSNNGDVVVQEKRNTKQQLLNEITPEDAQIIALKAVPGNLGEVEVDSENGIYFYDVEIVQNDLVKSVKVGVNGNILGIETEEPDVAITGTPLELASAAALEYIGEGRVTDSEIGDEEGYYEIEITLDNGDEVDVHLDQNYNVLSTEWE